MPVLTGRPILPMMPEQLANIIHGLFNFSNQSSHNIFILTQFSAHAQKNWIFGKTTKFFHLLKKSSKIQIKRYNLATIDNLKLESYSLHLKKVFYIQIVSYPRAIEAKIVKKWKKYQVFKKMNIFKKSFCGWFSCIFSLLNPYKKTVKLYLVSGQSYNVLKSL